MKTIMTALLMTAVLASPVVADDLSLTVYNNDLAVVKILDSFNLDKGDQEVIFTGVSNRIDPTSVRLSVPNGDVTVLEQNYRYDLVNSMKVLGKYIDRDVALLVESGDSVELMEGVLQSVAGDIVLKGPDGRVKIVRSEAVVSYDLPELPDGLITRPTLFWKLNSKRTGMSDREISYMTGGFSWHAEYSAVLSSDDDELELSSWVSIDNRSGASFENASLKLVAGDIHRATPQPRRNMMAKAMVPEAQADMGFEERSFFEYHLYDLGRRTDVANAEIKQISLFDPATVKVRKDFVYDSSKNPTKVGVFIEFENSDKDGLGMALPAGKVRVFKRDTDGDIELVGEDKVDHTPENEKVRLKLGNAFDLVAERKIVATRRISNNVREMDVEINLRNRKKRKCSITAVERWYGDWQITTTSHNYLKKDANSAEYTVDIPAGGETIITYTVRTR